MEWLLQVVDELDDAVGVLRHYWLGIHFRIPAGISAPFAPAAAGASVRGADSRDRPPEPSAVSNPL
jgi:hypothetical protein